MVIKRKKMVCRHMRLNSRYDSDYDTAVKMFHAEHARWNQWALFFFGTIAGIFVLAEKNLIPGWLSFFVASFVSLCWVAVAQNIRASTDSWRDVIFDIENHKHVKVFQAYNKYCKDWPRWQDLQETLCFWKKDLWISITRILSLIGIISFLICFAMGFSRFLLHFNNSKILISLISILFATNCLCIFFNLYKHILKRTN